MKNTRKIFAMATAIIMVLCLLAGCGGDSAKISAYEIYTKALAKQADTAAISMNMDIDMTMTMDGETIPMQMELSAKVASATCQ